MRHTWEPGTCAEPVGAGVPAKETTRYMAPAAPVFAGAPAPTKTVLCSSIRTTPSAHPAGKTPNNPAHALLAL